MSEARSDDEPGVAESEEIQRYLDAYSNFTDTQVAIDPHQAIGGLWDEIGPLQLDFLVSKGLMPHHRLLDIGCGTLRAGRHFIRYLDAGNYFGIDISPKAIEYAHELVSREGLSEKRPALIVSARKDLKFGEYEGEKFDYLLAQSVFTHLPPEAIAECLQHAGTVMSSSSAFYCTYKESPEYKAVPIAMEFRYPLSFFETLADQVGLHLEDCSADYAHPRGMSMLKMSRVTRLD